MGKESVLIIGAGIGGIATAVYLAKKGYDVTVFEKNPAPDDTRERVYKAIMNFRQS